MMTFNFLGTKQKQNNDAGTSGFTLVEVLVTLALFTVVATISLGSLIAMVNANRKAQALNSVMDNVNFTLENMVRTIRVGSDFRCGGVAPANPNCASGTTLFLEGSKGDRSDPLDDVGYRFNAANERIEISYDSGTNWLPLTASTVTVDDLNFTVEGVGPDSIQPFVIITLTVSTGPTAKIFTTLSLETSVSQRLPDI
jgi:prepilin-type N-terminal cleavage/methylation domain-containing protein